MVIQSNNTNILTEYKKDHDIYGVGKPGPGLEQAQKCMCSENI